MDKDYFYFKNFRIRNRDAAFKVNSDGVLLGAWVDVSDDLNLLEIGTGTGIITVMMALKNPSSKITAIDIHHDSCQEAQFNFELNRLNIKTECVPLQSFASDSKYDHIISNPPYFQDDSKPHNIKLGTSKHNESLSFSDIWDGVSRLSSRRSKLSVILPYTESLDFVKLGNHLGYSVKRELNVYSRKESKSINRRLLEFINEGVTDLISDSIYIHENGRDNYSEGYKKLTSRYYLKM